MNQRILTVVKTHYWDQGVADIVDANRQAVGDAKLIVLYDTTRSEKAPTKLSDVVYHSEKDYLSLGLYKNDHHRPLLWYNGDYTLYYARKAFPNFEYYLVCEYDCLIRQDIVPELEKLSADQIDFAAAQLGRRKSDWAWFSSLSDLPGDKYGCIFPFVFVSAKAIDALFGERLRMSIQASVISPSVWPFCEGFAPTVLKSKVGMKVSQLEKYFDLAFFRVQPSFDTTSEVPVDIRLVHPFLDDHADKRKQSELESQIMKHRMLKSS